MEWNLKKMWPVAATSLVTFTSLLSADDMQMQANKKQSDMNKKQTDNSRKMSCCCPEDMDVAYTPNASCYSPMDCGVGNWFITGSALYWNAAEDGLEYVLVDNDNAGGDDLSTIVDGEMQHLSFKWDWGFKVGLGYNFEHDGWDLYANWTWFRTHGRHSHGDEEGEDCDGDSVPSTAVLFPLYSDLGTTDDQLTASDAHATGHLRLNIVDLELGRAFYTSKWLTLRPHMGLRAAWIKQKHDFYYDGTNSDYPVVDATNDVAAMKNNFWGLGVRGGLDSRWGIGCGFSFYGNLAISILYGRFSVGINENIDVSGSCEDDVLTGVTNFTDGLRCSRAATDLALGFMYEHCFQRGCAPNKSDVHMALSIAWEHHIFFNQNQLWRVTRPSSDHNQAFGHERGDLTFQGWTFSARFDF